MDHQISFSKIIEGRIKACLCQGIQILYFQYPNSLNMSICNLWPSLWCSPRLFSNKVHNFSFLFICHVMSYCIGFVQTCTSSFPKYQHLYPVSCNCDSVVAYSKKLITPLVINKLANAQVNVCAKMTVTSNVKYSSFSINLLSCQSIR